MRRKKRKTTTNPPVSYCSTKDKNKNKINELTTVHCISSCTGIYIERKNTGLFGFVSPTTQQDEIRGV